MNSEESRLRTFANWPENAAVDSKRIARAGFFYIGQGLEVQCFRCEGRISDWNYGDKVMAKHKALDPRCPFVQNPASSGNIPLTLSRRSLSSPVEQSESRKEETFYDEATRLKSFASWPKQTHVMSSEMAKAGFYYTQKGTKIRCAYCNGEIDDFSVGDDINFMHIERFPNCSFGKDIVSKSEALSFYDCDSEGEGADWGIRCHRLPRRPRYSTYETRLRTFSEWPTSSSQTPNDLAEAGFYYVGFGDEVRCFHCDGGLGHWQKNDEPWIEHARWFDRCGFLSLVKGPEYIEEIKKSFPSKLTPNEEKIAQQLKNLPTKHVVTEEQLREQMSSHVAAAALQIGIEASRVKAAIRHKLLTTGTPFCDAGSLIIAAIEVQNQEENIDDDWLDRWTPTPARLRAILPRPDNHASISISIGSTTSDESEDEEERICQEERKIQNLQIVKKEEQDKPEKKEMSLEEENRKLKEARLCKVCMDVEVGIVFLPCGHLVTCANCAISLKDCPLCRQRIRATVRTYIC